MMNVNQFYSENMAEDIRRGLKDNAAECKVNGALPFGYTKGPDGKYAIDEPRAAIVREIFNRVLKGDKYVEIIESLNARGIKTRVNKPFSKGSFVRMLVNERYIGVYEHSGVRVEDGIPPIVSKEVFYMVQDKLKSKENEQGLKRSYNSDYLLTGKLYCGDCGSPMIGISGTSRNGDTHYYYSCKGRKLEDKCHKKNIQREFLENLVLDLTKACISSAEVIDWLVQGYIELKQQARDNSDLPIMEEELKDRKKALGNLLRAVENGIFNNTTNERMRELEEEIKTLEHSIEIGKLMFDEAVDGDRLVFYLHKISQGHPDGKKYRKELFRTFIKRVLLWDDRIEIEYNFTGTDGDGNPHKVVKQFLAGEGAETDVVRLDSAEPHHCRAIRTEDGLEISISVTFFGFTARAYLPTK